MKEIFNSLLSYFDLFIALDFATIASPLLVMLNQIPAKSVRLVLQNMVEMMNSKKNTIG